MKKIFNFILALAVVCVSSTVVSCGDNEDFSVPHVLTDAEIAEIARQDSIKKAEMERIDAELILEYSVEIPISQASYDGVMLPIDVTPAAELWGLTNDEVLAGIAEAEGAPEIKGFAIEGTTHAVNATKTNTNSYWGHWWDENGDVTAWGESAMIFAEFNAETSEFHVGQFPAHLTDGQVIKIIECLKYQDTRVAFVITATAKGAEKLTATVVSTQDYTVEMYPRSGYDADPVQFDREKVLADLGISDLSEAKIIGVSSDGSYAQECTATNGFWYNLEDGCAGTYDGGGLYVEYYGFDYPEDIDYLYVGQMPNALEEGYSQTLQYGFYANDKIVMINITVNIIAYQDPETAPEGEPTTDTVVDIVIDKAWDNTYSNVQYDIKDVLREAFKMTTYQIHKAKLAGDLKIYVDEVSEEEPSYTSDIPGYWLNADGKSINWGAESLVFVCLGSLEDSLWLYAGNHPDSCVPNTSVTTKYLICCNGGMVTANITVNVGDAAE